MNRSLSLAFFTILILACANESLAQISITNGKHSLEISGLITTFYNYRQLKPGQTNKSNNTFSIRDAQIQLEGRYGNLLEYELQTDFADMIRGQGDPENPGLMEASVQINAPKYLSVRVGYGKVDYSRNNMVPFVHSPFFSRAEISGGSVFSRRDIGASLIFTAWKQLFVASFGVYTGMGEIAIKGKNDPGGKPEFTARMSLSYPVKNRYDDYDKIHSPFPVICLGVNGRYTDKNNTYIDNYSLGVIGGKKYTYGGDLSIKYQGVSLQGEIHQLYVKPTDLSRLQGKNTKYFRAGGYYIQASYYNRKIKSAVALRYDELNQNDLVAGYGRRLTAGISVMPFGNRACLKINYTRILREELIPGTDPGKWSDQVRIGVSYLFQ